MFLLGSGHPWLSPSVIAIGSAEEKNATAFERFEKEKNLWTAGIDMKVYGHFLRFRLLSD